MAKEKAMRDSSQTNRTGVFAAFFSNGRSWFSAVLKRISEDARRSRKALANDWRGSRTFSFGLIAVLVSTLVVAAYFLNHPQPELAWDSPDYLLVAHNILSHGNLVDPHRTPGYPLVIALVFFIAGIGNLVALNIAQAVFFLLAVLEVYILTVLILKRAWIALIVALLIGTNTYLLSYVKPITIEGFALWLTVSFALSVVIFIRTLRPGHFWLVAGFTLAIFMTRPEWIYVPVPLFAYLLLIAFRRGKFRVFLPRALVAVALLYGILGFFIYENATENGYAGVSYVQNINLLGKVLQYRMQNEAPPQYASVTQKINTYFAQGGGTGPVDLADDLGLKYPEFSAHYWALAGAYGQSVITHHPIEFLLRSLPTLFTSLKGFNPSSQINPQGSFSPWLAEVNAFSADTYRTYQLFPIFLLIWGTLLLWRRTSRLLSVEMMGVVAFLALYELIMTTLAGYVDYYRLHIPFDPLMTVLIWGGILAGLPFLRPVLARFVLPRRLIWLGWGAVLLVALAGSVALAFLSKGVSGVTHPSAWLVVRLLSAHPLLLVAALALGVWYTVQSYQTRHPALKAPA